MKRVRIVGLGFAVAMATTSCMGVSSSDAANPPGPTVSSTVGPEKPRAADDFERTCADGLGFAAQPAYTKAPGVIHQAVLMEKRDGDWHEDWLIGNDYPGTWFLATGQTPEKVELVVCVEKVREFANGKTCQMQHRATKKPFTLRMFDSSYLVRVLDAQTGKTLLYHAGTKSSKDCPYMTFNRGEEDETKYVTEADAKDYRPLIKPFVAP